VVTILTVKGKHGEQENTGIKDDDKSGGLICEPESIEDVEFDEEGQLILAEDIEPQEVQHSAQEQLGFIEAYVRSPKRQDIDAQTLTRNHHSYSKHWTFSIFLKMRTGNFSDLLDLSYWRPLPTSHKEARD